MSYTDFPAYSDTGYCDFPLTVTVLTDDLSYIKNDVVTVTLAYSDTFLLSGGCHCKRGRLYLELYTCIFIPLPTYIRNLPEITAINS